MSTENAPTFNGCVWVEVKIANSFGLGIQVGGEGPGGTVGCVAMDDGPSRKSETRNYFITTFRVCNHPPRIEIQEKDSITSIGEYENWKCRGGIEESLFQQTKTSQLITLPKQKTTEGGV
jgi:hypothetical protein